MLLSLSMHIHTGMRKLPLLRAIYLNLAVRDPPVADLNYAASFPGLRTQPL